MKWTHPSNLAPARQAVGHVIISALVELRREVPQDLADRVAALANKYVPATAYTDEHYQQQDREARNQPGWVNQDRRKRNLVAKTGEQPVTLLICSTFVI